MRILWLITAGSLLLSIANSENDVPIANNVQRVPRALILQPMMKVKAKDDDEGPFDFISDWLSRVINPPKKPVLPRQPPMLGPIHVPGLNDQVFIKQMEAMPHRNSHVVIKVMQNGHNNMPMTMPLDMNPYQKQKFPMTSTRQIPMQSGFYPLPSPTPNSNPSWSPITPQSHYPSPYTNNMYDSSNSIRNGYNNHPNHFRNFRNVPGYQNNFIPNQSNQLQVPQQNNNNRYQQQWKPQPQQYYGQYQSTSQSFYSPYDPRYRPHASYGGNDFYNTIPGTDGRFSNYGVDSSGSTNYSRHPIHQHAHVTTTSEENRPIKEREEDERNSNSNNSRDREEIIEKTKFKNVQLPKANPTSAKISTNPAELIEIYRSDRMVPTNPTYRNRFWTRASKTTNKVSSTTECYSDDQAEESSKKERKYSSRGIEEIRAPNLKAWKESIEDKTEDEQNSDSRMDDEDGIIMEDGTTLGRGESQEHSHEEISRISGSRSNSGNISSSNSSDSISNISNSSDNSSNRGQLELPEPSDNARSVTSRISRNWKPMEQSKRKENTGISNSTEVVNTTPKVLEKSSSTIASNSWRHHDTEKLRKRKLPRYKNNQRRVRVVESVRSSVSMTSSRGVKKPKIKN